MASAQDLMHALARGDRLTFFAHLNPRIWEVVGGGPLGRRLHAAADLNPQPLPPRWGHRAFDPQPDPPGAVAALIGYSQLVTMAIAAIGSGEGGDKTLLLDVEDWCGTGWPRRWPPPKPKLDGDDDLAGFQLGAAFAAAQLAAAYEDGRMQELFTVAADQLLEASLAR